MTKVEELREIAIHVAAMGFGEMSEYHGYNIGMYNEDKEAERLVDDLIAAAREEGAELERARIRDSNPFVFTGEYYVLPAAVLAPKEESK